MEHTKIRFISLKRWHLVKTKSYVNQTIHTYYNKGLVDVICRPPIHNKTELFGDTIIKNKTMTKM